MGKQAVFIDLQGTLGGDGIGDITGFTFYPFAIEAIKLLNKNDILAIIITNQSHIAKGYFTYETYEVHAERIRNELKTSGAFINQIYCCPHGHKDNCTCKKPLRGMIDKAMADLDIDLSESYVIGDMGSSDMILAKDIGCKGVLVRTGVGEGSLKEFRYAWQEVDPDYIAENILEGVKWILAERK